MGTTFPHLNPYQHSELRIQKLLETKIVLNIIRFFVFYMSEWPSGLRRQTQGNTLLPDKECEISGPRLRAGVRIPFLTRSFPYDQNILHTCF
jgi:hypothetical protein